MTVRRRHVDVAGYQPVAVAGVDGRRAALPALRNGAEHARGLRRGVQHHANRGGKVRREPGHHLPQRLDASRRRADHDDVLGSHVTARFHILRSGSEAVMKPINLATPRVACRPAVHRRARRLGGRHRGARGSSSRHVAPDSGAAYVVILHLSPDHDSQLAEVLQVTAPIPVTQVTSARRDRADHVYVIPPNKMPEHRRRLDRGLGHDAAGAAPRAGRLVLPLAGRRPRDRERCAWCCRAPGPNGSPG